MVLQPGPEQYAREEQQDLRHRRPAPDLSLLGSRPHGGNQQQRDEQRRQAQQDDERNPEPGWKVENEPGWQAFHRGRGRRQASSREQQADQ